MSSADCPRWQADGWAYSITTKHFVEAALTSSSASAQPFLCPWPSVACCDGEIIGILQDGNMRNAKVLTSLPTRWKCTFHQSRRFQRSEVLCTGRHRNSEGKEMGHQMKTSTSRSAMFLETEFTACRVWQQGLPGN